MLKKTVIGSMSARKQKKNSSDLTNEQKERIMRAVLPLLEENRLIHESVQKGGFRAFGSEDKIQRDS